MCCGKASTRDTPRESGVRRGTMSVMHSPTPLDTLLQIRPAQKKALTKLGIQTADDLLHHFPSRYEKNSETKTIASLQTGSSAVVYGRIHGLKTLKAFHKRIPMAEGILTDDTGSIKIIWFHQPYLAKMLGEGTLVRIEGNVAERKGVKYFSNPKAERVERIPSTSENLFGAEHELHALHPVYPETRGITSNWLYHAVQKVLQAGILDRLTEDIPEEILARYHLPTLRTALIWIHTPKNEKDAQAARKRFAFEEIFFIQLEKQRARKEFEREKAFVIEPSKESLQSFISRFPFSPTKGQHSSIQTILSDFKRGHPMARLLEGDVGAGKTAVAATTAYAVITSRPSGQDFGHLQVAYMVPTEVLAKQQFESFVGYFAHLGVNVGLITGSGCRKFPSKVNPHGSTDISRTQLLKWVGNGEIPILVGTHALIQKSVEFKHLAFVIIDEQHRFGTLQRQKLTTKEELKPHLLSMTATPIPRTLALTIYGDLDLSVLDEMPVGRKPVITEIIDPENRNEVYEKVRKQLALGRQAFVICPRIDEPDPTKELALQAKSAIAEATRLKKEVFPEYEIDILHSKMKNDDKEKVMDMFKDGRKKILVSTSVVEVGVNVPNATVMIIEGAERFGLAQLHQLRGRIIRSNDQAYCYVFTESKTKTALARLKALQTAKNGFELAERDLEFRGTGELYGRKQWGVSDVAMEALQNIKMVEAARTEARAIIDTDPMLTKHSLLKERLERQDAIHFE